MDRSAASVRSYAWRRALRFNGAAGAPLRSFLRRGGRLVREDMGGAVGVRWAPAHRSGPSFEAALCERLAELKLIRPLPGRADVFCSASASPSP